MQLPSEASEDLCLSYLEVLDDEDRALSGEDGAPEDTLREEYARAKRLKGGVEYEQAERAYRASLFRRLHRHGRSALCFSGGGIRSATFGLGILQGLAALSRDDCERPRLLGEFDYLSTVSGGGYLGAWFSAWAKRIGHPLDMKLKDCHVPDACDGPAEVIRELSKTPGSTFEPEAAPVKQLRMYSNYLTPALGFLSGDSWALVATVVRNMFLNWLVLLPLLAATLLIPVLSWQLLLAKPNHNDGTLWFLLISAMAMIALATAYAGCNLPNAGNREGNSSQFILLGLAPLCMGAIHLVTFWAWLPAGNMSAPWWNVVALGTLGLSWWHFALLGVVMHGGGMLAGIGYVSIRYGRPPRRIGLAATAAAVITGFLGGLLGFLVSQIPDRGPVTGEILDPKLYAVLAFPMLMAVFLFAGALLVGATSYVTEDEDREWWARAGGWYLVIALGWVAFAFIVLYATDALHWADLRLSAAFTAATGLTGWGTARLGASPSTPSGQRENDAEASKLLPGSFLKEHAAKLLLPVFLILLLMLLSAANFGLIKLLGKLPAFIPSFWPGPLAPLGQATARTLWLILGYTAVCLVTSAFINVNKFSLHGMYRERLIRAYLGASNSGRKPNPFTGFDENDNLSMCSLTQYKPLHVVNMTLNLVHGSNLAWQQRKAEPFSSTRLHTGSCRLGYRDSAFYGGKYNARTTPISLGTSITISGAAASPNMGYHSSPLLTLVMTLFNARLGWWLGNPKAKERVWKRPGPRLGVRAFIDEALGLTDDTNDWIYLSDGGHFENLGLYEMVLRRCSLIVVCDAGADPSYTYEDVGNAVRKVRIDLGIPIEFEKPSMPMSPAGEPSEKFSGSHCAIGHIHYGAVDPGAKAGTLIYIKASMNGNEPADVKQYAALELEFPHQPTLDQFFDETQFESYRRLGQHIIEEICGAARGMTPQLDLEEFIKRAESYARAGASAVNASTAAGARGDLSHVISR
jgi:hypothetical protein